jgi:two-component system, OmpR family, response regulator MprA
MAYAEGRWNTSCTISVISRLALLRPSSMVIKIWIEFMSYIALYPEAERRSPAPPVAPGTNMQKSNEILIVDDEAPIAQLLADVLYDEGYATRVARDGATALLEIMKRPPGLVILDVAMPVMLGSDLLVYLRRHGFEHLPIIIMTAGLSPMVYLAQGATEVMPKPFDVDLVVEKVARYLPLEHHRPRDS